VLQYYNMHAVITQVNNLTMDRKMAEYTQEDRQKFTNVLI